MRWLSLAALMLLQPGNAACAGQSRQAEGPAGPGPAPALATDRIDTAVREEALARGVPGVAVAIVQRGELQVLRAYGMADQESGRAVTIDTPFNIASLTKPFTAIVALVLARDSVVSLDESVVEHLPDLPRRYAAVTIRHLLGHTSGVDRDLREENLDDPDASEYRFRLDTASVSAPPGARWEYSNTGYTLLGWVLAAAATEPLGDLMQAHIFDPLGMRGARYRVPLDRDSLRARPYEVTTAGSRRAPYVSGGFASGGLSMSISDLARFAVALDHDRLLSDGEKRLLWTPVALSDGSPVEFQLFGSPAGYGFGWFLARFADRHLVTHGGGISGFSSNLYHFPDDRLTLIVLANAKARDDGVAPVDALARRLAMEYFRVEAQ